MTDTEPVVLELCAQQSGKKHKITARVNDAAIFVDVLDPANAGQRAKFVAALRDKCPAVPPEAVETELLKIAATGALESPNPATRSAPETAEVPADILANAEAMLGDPELIRRVCDDVEALGVAGERELALTVYLIGVSRLLPKPLAGIVRGSSSSGKSFLIGRVAELAPPEAVIHATQMTPQALFHMPPGSLRHKWVVAGERSRLEDDDRAEATRALREMLSEGKLSKLMPVKTGGEIVTVQIDQDGPIAFVESTTLTEIFEEDANRCLLLQTDEREEQTRRIIRQLAGRHTSPAVRDPERIRMTHHTLQRQLPRADVRVPFADRVAEKFDCRWVEARRAFTQLLALVQASALLHHRQREVEAGGTILAAATDYQIARRLIAKPFALSIGGGVSDATREFFGKLKGHVNGGFTTAEVVETGVAGKSTVSSRLWELNEAGAAELVEPGRGRSPGKWRLTGRDPDPGRAIIPAVEDLFPELAHPRTGEHNAQLAVG